MKTWTMVTATFDRAPEDWAVFTEVFDRFGVPGTVQTDRPPTLSGYAYEPSPEDLRGLCDELIRFGASSADVSQVAEENWAETWKQFFKPRDVGKSFVVVPSWETYTPSGRQNVLLLDPGQAFGTGDHPTTRLCLELMERIPMAGLDVADIGCGSGILSIGALLLGAKSVVAVDVERCAVEASRDNAKRNRVEFVCYEGKGFEPIGERHPTTFGLVLSNIISAALIQLAPSASKRVAPGGHWIVSGVIEANWSDVLSASQRAGFGLVERVQEDDWVAATFRR